MLEFLGLYQVFCPGKDNFFPNVGGFFLKKVGREIDAGCLNYSDNQPH